MDIVGELPVEIGRSVLGYLEGWELAVCCRVSARWRSLANHHSLWRRLLSLDGLSYESLLPLKDDPVVGELEEECHCKRLYGRGERALSALRNNRITKIQLEGGSVSPLANGQILAVLSPRRPCVHLYDLSADLAIVQTVVLPRLKSSIQLAWSSRRYLVLESYPSALVCYGVKEGRLERVGILHVERGELKMESEWEEGREYRMEGLSVLHLLEDTLILREPHRLRFFSLEPFGPKAEVRMGIPSESYRTEVVGGRLFLINSAGVTCFERDGSERCEERLGGRGEVGGWRIRVVGDDRWTGLVGWSPEEESSCLVRGWWWDGGGRTPQRLLTFRPPMAAPGPRPLTLLHFTSGDSLLCSDLQGGGTLWSLSLGPSYVSSTTQLFSLAPRFAVIRTETDYTVIEASNGHPLFSNPEKRECGHIYAHKNPRAFVFYDAQFSRIILHVFSW